jgi:uracil-DNA glycosylase family 4
MMQSEQARRAYLRAMGIDVWIPRDQADVEPGLEDAVTDTGAGEFGWDDLRAAVTACTRCRLHESRTQTVFGVGDPAAEWMIIGEAPGAEEDRRGEPFVGRAGKLLDEMLLAIGEKRESVFIANILKCRPPNNRDPSADEAASCRPYLDRQIELVGPRVILAVGRIAAQQLLQTDTPVGRLRGKVHQVGATPLVVTYHPAYLLRSPSQKRKSWDDLCLARQVMAGASG